MRITTSISDSGEEILPQSLITNILANLRDELAPLCRELVDLQEKGATKTASDLLQIKELKKRIEAKAQAALGPILGSDKPVRVDFDFGEDPSGQESASQQPEPADDTEPTFTRKTIHEALELLEIETDGKTYARGEAPLFFTDLTRSFAHGADTIIFPAAFAEKILQPGERLTLLQEVTWKRPMKHSLYIEVREGDPLEKSKLDQCDMYGSFATSSGRVLNFSAIRDESKPIINKGKTNPYAERIMCICNECFQSKEANSFEFHMGNNNMPDEAFDDLEESQALKVATLLELLSKATALASANHQAKTGSALCRLKLMGGVRNLPIPANMRVFFGKTLIQTEKKLTVRLLDDQQRPGKSGMAIMPFEFQFPHQTDMGTGIIAQTNSNELIDRHLDR